MRLVEVYSPDLEGPRVRLGTFEVRVPSLIEDDDGIRFVVLDQPQIGEHDWRRAAQSGAVGILLVSDYDGWVSADDFADTRVLDPVSRTYEVRALHVLTSPANSYFEIQDALPEAPEPQLPPDRYVSLHTHTEASPLDGVSRVSELVEAVQADGAGALAVTDHATCAAHPALQEACDAAGIKPIFGIEANLTKNRRRRGGEGVDAKEVLGDYWHLCLWALDDTGLTNLWAASTEANRTGFYARPRMDWEVLADHAEGVACGTGCLRGPLAEPLLAGNTLLARQRLAQLLEIYGDRLYVELHTCQLDEVRRLNPLLVDLAREYKVPILAVTDTHYPTRDDATVHEVWIAAQTQSDLTDDTGLFEGDALYHYHTTEEVLDALAYLGEDVAKEAVATTVALAERATARITPVESLPVYTDSPADDVDRLVRLCLGSWHKTLRGRRPQEEYEARFEHEMRLLVDKGFCGYYLQVADYCRYAREHGILIGPSRGSGGGSLVAYLAGITGIDPVDTGLLFERFLNPGRDALPDFDIDFPASRRDDMTAYLNERWGEDRVVRVGTHLRLKNKGVIRDMARVLASIEEMPYTEIDQVSQIIDAAEADTAGLGMEWDDLWAQFGDQLAPYRERYPSIFAFADRLVGRLKTYGRHPAGYIISTDQSLTDRLPMRNADGQLVTDWDMEALEALRHIKFDLLTLRTLDTLQQAVDLIHERHGHRIDFFDWDEEYDDPQLWAEVQAGHTLGMFQVETNVGTQGCRRFQPSSVHDLADVITLIRPGPARSGLDRVYERRAKGIEPVTYPHPDLAEALDDTYGAMIYQEQVMAICSIIAGYSLAEADDVRRILGKKKIEKIDSEGRRFRARAAERGYDPALAERLWDQMAEFARYSFNRAHAYAYAVLGVWCGWLKIHYPHEFLTAVLSTVDKDRVPEFVAEARRLGISVLPPDINRSGRGFTLSDDDVIRYGLDNVKGVGAATADAIIGDQPFEDIGSFLARRDTAKVDSGSIKLLASIGAFDSLEPHRRWLEDYLDWVLGERGKRCRFKDEAASASAPNGLPCTYDWENEPRTIGKSGRPLKQKPVPKRCAISCRRYVAPAPPRQEGFARYTDEEIRLREREQLGTYLSSTPFDRLPPDLVEEFDVLDADALEQRVVTDPPTTHLVVATIDRIRPHTDRTGRKMGFVTLGTPSGKADAVVFHNEWVRHARDLKLDRLVAVEVRKTSRGLNVEGVMSL